MEGRESLDSLRYKIDMHLIFEKDVGKLEVQAYRLMELAKLYKDAGYLKDAIGQIQKALKIVVNGQYAEQLLEYFKEDSKPPGNCPYLCGQLLESDSTSCCPSCRRLIKPCPYCRQYNQNQERYCRWCGAAFLEAHSKNKVPHHIQGFKLEWFTPFEVRFARCPPLVVADAVLISCPEKKSIIGLRLLDGVPFLEVEHSLSSSSACKLGYNFPYVYVFSIDEIRRFLLEVSKTTEVISPLIPDSLTDVLPHMQSLEASHSIAFADRNGLFIHDCWRQSGSHVPIDSKEKLYLYPFLSDQTLYALSDKGHIWDFSNDKPEIIEQIDPCDRAGVPVRHPESGSIFFQSAADGKRFINTWLPSKKKLFQKLLSDTLFMPEDLKLAPPPMIYKSGVLLTAVSEPRLFLVTESGFGIDNLEVDIFVEIGSKKASVVESIFSTVYGKYLVSRIPNGFFCVDLENTTDYRVEFFSGNGDMLMAPVFTGERLIFLCDDGIRCYSF